MRVSYPGLAIVALALAPAAARPAPPAPVSFDASKHVYWCGQPLQSPLAFTLGSGEMRINGLTHRSLPSDTTDAEQEAQRVFGNVPEVQRLHLHGYPYRGAKETLGWILARNAARIRAAYIRSASLGAVKAHDVAVAMADTGLFDVSKPMLVDSLRVRFTPRGLSSEVEFSGTPGTITGLKELKSPEITLTESTVAERAESIRRALAAPGPVVLLADDHGETSISGQKAVEAERTIESLIAATKAGTPVEYGPEHVVLGRRSFELIVNAARKP